MSLQIRYKNLVLDQESDFYLRNLNIPITCLLDICMDILGRSFMLITSGSYSTIDSIIISVMKTSVRSNGGLKNLNCREEKAKTKI